MTSDAARPFAAPRSASRPAHALQANHQDSHADKPGREDSRVGTLLQPEPNEQRERGHDDGADDCLSSRSCWTKDAGAEVHGATMTRARITNRQLSDSVFNVTPDRAS